MGFDNLKLNKQILNAIEEIGFKEPTPIQEQAFSVILSGKDTIGIAQTGTGKTFAYLLPILSNLKYSEQRNPRVLILVPTRELVIQVVTEIEKLTKFLNIRCAGVYGGVNIKNQKEIVNNGLDILVATPGRFIDLVLTSILRLMSVQKVVFDEVDEMFNLGFRVQLDQIMELLPEKRQNIMFSATLREEVELFISNFFYEPKKVIVSKHGKALEQIRQKIYLSYNFNTKLNLLKHLITKIDFSKLIVFVSTKRFAKTIFENLSVNFSEQIEMIHSNKAQNTRMNIIKRFHEGEIKILIATDIVARGVDMKNVSHVINFDIPVVPGDYLHRIGRTGRAQQSGIAISFVSEFETENIANIEKLINEKIYIEEFPQDVEISEILIKEEKPEILIKLPLKEDSVKSVKGAFHEKKEKNKKVNLGGPSKTKRKIGSVAKKRLKKQKKTKK